MSFSVSLTDGAKSDVRSILEWINGRSPAGAAAWYRSWQKILHDMEERADRYSISPESDDHPEVIRQAIFKTRRGRPYRALFMIRERRAFILHIRGPGQDLLDPDEIQMPD